VFSNEVWLVGQTKTLHVACCLLHATLIADARREETTEDY